MVKVLNILVLSYLVVAPGMNVDSLLHAVELCRFTQPAVSGHHEETACDHHSHAPEHEDDQEHSDDGPCGHYHQLTADSGAIGVSMSQSHTAPALVSSVDVSTSASFSRLASTLEVVRPPPNLGLTGTIRQLV